MEKPKLPPHKSKKNLVLAIASGAFYLLLFGVLIAFSINPAIGAGMPNLILH